VTHAIWSALRWTVFFIYIILQWWPSYLYKVAALVTPITGKRNCQLLIRYPFFIVTVPLQLLVTAILNVGTVIPLHFISVGHRYVEM
jgi:hypothetical protein